MQYLLPPGKKLYSFHWLAYQRSRSKFSFIIFQSLKNYCFAIKDELNTDVRCDFYLPGNLYRIEIITDGPRDAKAEISEAPSGMTSNLSLKTPRQHRFIFVG